jgi:choline dehydrogenase
LLLEAGDDTGSNLDEEIAGWFFLTWGDPTLSWNFFVKYHSDDNITKQ